MIYRLVLKRTLDLLVSSLGLIILSPILLSFSIIIYLNDFESPFYIAPRVGKGSKLFNIIKFRSMIVNADKSKVDSTGSNDIRITPIGHIIRKYKLDEFTQLFNVLIGNMSLVGPRPNVKRETDTYSIKEKMILGVKPGITDFSSIIFSDEGEILKESIDPDLDYNQLIRPYKSRFAIFYIENFNFIIDMKIIILTVLSIFDREKALIEINKILLKMEAPLLLTEISLRNTSLKPYAPPGMRSIITTREINHD